MADHNKGLEQELLRKRLRPAEYISNIEECMEHLRAHWQTMGKNQIDALRAIIQANSELLDKSLPDLRAVDMTPEKEAPVRFLIGGLGEDGDSPTLNG